MALIKCPECGHDVSTFAKSCPNCGYPISDEESADLASQTYSLIVPEPVSKKIPAILILQKKFGYGLAAAKRLVETQGAVIRSGLSREEAEDLVAEFDAEGVYLAFVASGEIKGRDKPACPRCGSQSIQVMRKGGFDFGKAAFGAAMFGPFGSSAGLVGSNDMMRVCANCGYKF